MEEAYLEVPPLATHSEDVATPLILLRSSSYQPPTIATKARLPSFPPRHVFTSKKIPSHQSILYLPSTTKKTEASI